MAKSKIIPRRRFVKVGEIRPGRKPKNWDRKTFTRVKPVPYNKRDRFIAGKYWSGWALYQKCQVREGQVLQVHYGFGGAPTFDVVDWRGPEHHRPYRRNDKEDRARIR